MSTRPPLSISKTDYKVARSCASKLYYRMYKYPSAKDGDEYMELLAEGGYMIGAIASLLFENAVLVDEPDHNKAVEMTSEYFKQENIILLEAAFESKGKFARPDILIKQGDILTLIEVKAKSFDSSDGDPFHNKRGGIVSGWQPYLEDITFQALILRELFPQFSLTCELMMPDKSKTTTIDNLHSLFNDIQVNENDSGYPRARFRFIGDVDELRHSHFLTRISVNREVGELLPEVSTAAETFIKSLNPLTKLPAQIAFACKDCEYRVDNSELKNGFRECWGELADPQPHILELYFGGMLKEVQALIEAGKTHLFDLPESTLSKKDGSMGARAQRQLIQMRNSKSKTEWIDPALSVILDSYPYPLHFIDFETSGLAVPYHAGMRPFENVAFQWSCHTIEAPGGEPFHTEWINLEDAYPNFAFAESLMNQLGYNGTVYMWATHENTILKDILRQMDGSTDKQTLKDWLAWITNGRLVDMNKLTLNHYFHPVMMGRTSIKKVLDAVWQINPALRKRYPQYVKEKDGIMLSPHRSLPPLEIAGEEVVVKEGTAAIAAYQAMLYGPRKADAFVRDQWQQLLLEYCKLDTLAMVMIYWHWQDMLQAR